MKISKQYLRQLIMEELEQEAIEIPGGPMGHYDQEKDKFTQGQGPDPEQNLQDMLIQLQTSIETGDRKKSMELVNAVRSMVVQFAKDRYTGEPTYSQGFVQKLRTGK